VKARAAARVSLALFWTTAALGVASVFAVGFGAAVTFGAGIREIACVPFRTSRADQEEEATNLGGTLLLPRPLLLRAVARGMEPDAVATEYGVTIEMARFRLNTTAVARQLERARARRAR